MAKVPRFSSAALLCLLLIAFLIQSSSCRKDKPLSAKKEDKGTITIGLVPEQNIFKQFERYEPLAAYLSKRIGTKVVFKVLPGYGNLVENFQSSGLDGAFFGSFLYVIAHERLDVEVIARPEDEKGISTYCGLIFVRKDSGIAGAKDMKGKVFAMVDRATSAGYLFPLAYFKKNGIKNYKKYFKEVYFAGTHEDAIDDVFNKIADIGAAKNTVFERMAVREPAEISELKVLERSVDFPENGLALKRSLDASLREGIAKVLLSMNEDPEGVVVLKQFGARRFIETSSRDYSSVVAIAKEAGIEPSKVEDMGR